MWGSGITAVLAVLEGPSRSAKPSQILVVGAAVSVAAGVFEEIAFRCDFPFSHRNDTAHGLVAAGLLLDSIGSNGSMQAYSARSQTSSRSDTSSATC